jgi:hypothetical protein
MTLEAWIYPTAPQRGWRAVLQKEFDAYFLLASSRAGALRPSGGGTFGAATEDLVAPAIIPTRTWTHVAMTYDGAVSELYVNGDLVARRLRWYPGHVVSATLDGLTVPSGLSTESRQLRARLLAGAPLTVRAVAAAPMPTPAPLVTLHDATRNEILLLAAEGDDIVVRLRSRAAAVGLDDPAIRAAGLLRGIRPGDALTVTVWRVRGRYCIAVNEHPACGFGFTIGMGWALLAYSQVPAGWLHATLNCLWVAVLVFPYGFWLRYRWESLLGAFILIASVLLACAVGTLGASLAEIGTGLLAIVIGGTVSWTRTSVS